MRSLLLASSGWKSKDGLHFLHEGGGCKFISNVGKFLSDCMVSHPRVHSLSMIYNN
jgi:hypothetical protein